MMEEQNQEKATAMQHMTMADAAIPETGNGKKEDKGGGKEERKTAKSLAPKQLQQRKKLTAYPLIGLLFLGPTWPIFTPSGKWGVNRDTVGASNADTPPPENDGIIGGRRKTYEQAQTERQQVEKVRLLEDPAFSEESDVDRVEIGLPDSKPEQEPFRDYSGNGGGRFPITTYRDINRKLGSFYEEPKVDGEKGGLKRQAEELTAKLEGRERQTNEINDQVVPMEKSYELATKYMGQSGRDGVTIQAPATGQDGSGLGQPAVAVQAVRERTVSGLRQPLSDAEFMRWYSRPRNYGLNTAVDSGYALGKNTIAVYIHRDQTVTDGRQMKLWLLEPLQIGNLTIPRDMVVSGTGKVQGGRLNITISSVQCQGNTLPVELVIYDNEGTKGLCIETSLEREATKGVMVSIDDGSGTNISFARSVGQQVAIDITCGLMRGGSRYLAKRFHMVKVHLKVGGPLILYAKQL